MTQTMTITEGLDIINAQLKGVRERSLDDNRERESGIKGRAIRLTTAQLVEVITVAQALANLPLGVLSRADRSNVADVYRVYSREWRDTRF
jgi:hypothetical protein